MSDNPITAAILGSHAEIASFPKGAELVTKNGVTTAMRSRSLQEIVNDLPLTDERRRALLEELSWKIAGELGVEGDF